MALKNLSRQALMRRVETGQVQSRRLREKTTQTVEGLVQTGVSAATAFGVSFISAKMGGAEGVTLGPVPLELALGLTSLGISMTGLGGEAGKYLTSMAKGSLDAFAANQGRNAGLARAA